MPGHYQLQCGSFTSLTELWVGPDEVRMKWEMMEKNGWSERDDGKNAEKHFGWWNSKHFFWKPPSWIHSHFHFFWWAHFLGLSEAPGGWSRRRCRHHSGIGTDWFISGGIPFPFLGFWDLPCWNFMEFPMSYSYSLFGFGWILIEYPFIKFGFKFKPILVLFYPWLDFEWYTHLSNLGLIPYSFFFILGLGD